MWHFRNITPCHCCVVGNVCQKYTMHLLVTLNRYKQLFNNDYHSQVSEIGSALVLDVMRFQCFQGSAVVLEVM